MVRRWFAYLVLVPLLGVLVSAPARAVQCVCDASKNGATTMANKVLQHAEVIQIFWGTGWSTNNRAAAQDAQFPNHVWVRAVGGSWKDTGSFAGLPRIAQLAVSAEGVYAMAGDSTAVYRYDPRNRRERRREP